MKRTYIQLNINERINLRSHNILPLAYFYKNNKLDKDIQKVFHSFKATVSEMMEKPLIDHSKFGMSVMPHYMEIYRCECLFGKTYDPNKLSNN